MLPAPRTHPVVTLPPGGLGLLREAYRHGPFAAELSEMVTAGEEAIVAELWFPPRGGHHNMWYQCDDCQAPLRTISISEHQCRLCGNIYSGEPYDDVAFRAVHSRNLRRASTAAWAYALTGENRFAAFTREVFLGYAERYLNYEYRHASRRDTPYARVAGGRIFDQTLTEASYLLSHIAPAYDLIHDSEVLSEEDHTRIRTELLHPLLQSIARHQRGRSNWQSFHNAALFWTGAVLGETDWMERSIHDPDHGFLDQMEISLTPDGMWFEGSWSYHFYTLTALGRHAQGASNLGMDLWGHPAFRKMFTLPMAYIMPDGTMPRFGNATTLRPQQWATRWAEITEAAYRAYGDERLLGLLPQKENRHSLLHGNLDLAGRGKVDHLPSAALPASGHAMLRRPGPGNLTAAFSFAQSGEYHAHFDLLSFVFFGFGEELGVDRGRAASQAYRLPIHEEWYRATISHNTVLVDGQTQQAAGANLLFFEAKEDYAAAVAATSQAYPGVHHRRMILLTEDYLLTFDDLQADEARRFDWFYHNTGTRADLSATTRETILSGPGYDYIQDARQAQIDVGIAATFAHPSVSLHLREAGAPGTIATVGHGPGSAIDVRIPLLFLMREGKTASFAASYEPVRQGEAPSIDRISWRRLTNGIELTVHRASARDLFLLRDDHRIEALDPAQ